MPDFLLEIGCEEIPARMIADAASELAQRTGVRVENLKLVETEKGLYVCAQTKTGGRFAADILVEYLPTELKQLRWPKAMYWRVRAETFVRPVRWIVALLDNEIVP